MDNQDKYLALRRQYPVFEYVDYHYRVEPEGLRLWFDFRMGDVEFHPTATVERRPFLDLERPGLDRAVFDIGMVELVSYWKCTCPPAVRVLCGSLTDSQIAFWRKLYWHGLGEFFYTNGIRETPEAFMQIVGTRRAVSASMDGDVDGGHGTPCPCYLVPVGGGKDSVVTLELLRRAGKTVRPLIMNPRGATTGCAQVAGFSLDEVLVIRRTIDPTLLDLNAQGYLNGHTPFSAMLAFYTRLASLLSGVPNVALSNEDSANESTVRGSDVNHQYSKSLEFEDDFREYCVNASMCKCVSADAPATDAITHSHTHAFNYFSFLRPLSELQIAMLFSRLTDYHDVFRSCNVGSKQDIWCGHCAKCLFAYIILSPFMAPERLAQIFGHDLLDDTTLRTEFDQLCGRTATKPFECVGTVDEVLTALSMAVERWYGAGRPALLEGFVPVDAGRRTPLHSLLDSGNLSAEERNILKQCIEKNS